MTLARRVRNLEAGGSPGQGGESPSNSWRCACEAFLTLVPADLRERLGARLPGPSGSDTEALASWVAAPFAGWAAPAPSVSVLPRALVAWVLSPPRPFWFGHHCGTCGLAVPLYLVPSGVPNPPADPRAFPTCPACGGATRPDTTPTRP